MVNRIDPEDCELAHKLRKVQEAHFELLRKYCRLVELLTKATGELTAISQHDLDLYRMAGWAVRTSSNGWAVVADGKLRLTNLWFDKMNRPDQPGDAWQVVSDDPSRKVSTEIYFSIGGVAIAEAARLRAGSEQMRLAHYASGERVVEVTVDRSPSGESGAASLVVVRDVTDRLRVEAELSATRARLVEQERMVVAGELSAGIAHDLNNLLAAAAFRLAMVPEDNDSSSTGESNLSVVRRIIESGQSLLARLQSLGKPYEPTLAPIDLGETVLSAIDIVATGLKIGSGGPIRIRTKLFPLPPVLGSAEGLRNVIINLLLNARDAMPEGGTVEVRVRLDRDHIVLLVEDEGHGIADEHMSRIFDAFFTTKGAKGTGMGLAIAKETMEKSGGSITARNRAAGGACFELRFVPWKPEQESPVEVAEEPSESGVRVSDSASRLLCHVAGDVERGDRYARTGKARM